MTSAGNVALLAVATGARAIRNVVVFAESTSFATLTSPPFTVMAAVSAANNSKEPS